MELRPFRSLRGAPRFKERRPGLWIDRQVTQDREGELVVALLVGLVRLSDTTGIAVAEDLPSTDLVSRRVGALVATKTDSEPCLLATRAPLAASLATTRRPDATLTDDRGVRHDLIRIDDYAQHVELQGLVKSADAELLSGRLLWDAARQFSVSPAAAKLSGARYKLCAIVDERRLGDRRRRPDLPAGILGFSLEDPVY